MVVWNYFRNAEIIEIIIRDNTGKKLEQHKINASDKKLYMKIITYIENKYGLSPEIEKDILDDENSLI
jgi:hypothetical protein